MSTEDWKYKFSRIDAALVVFFPSCVKHMNSIHCGMSYLTLAIFSQSQFSSLQKWPMITTITVMWLLSSLEREISLCLFAAFTPCSTENIDIFSSSNLSTVCVFFVHLYIVSPQYYLHMYNVSKSFLCEMYISCLDVDSSICFFRKRFSGKWEINKYFVQMLPCQFFIRTELLTI